MFSAVTHQTAQDDAYHAMAGWSVSQWKLLADHPEEFYGFHVAHPPLWEFERTPAIEFGTKVHGRLLEPETFSARYPEAGPCAAVLKSGKNAGQPCGNAASNRTRYGYWYCGVHAKSAPEPSEPVECLTSVDAARLNSIVRAAHADPKVYGCLSAPGEVEYSLFGTHAETGLQVRGRLDKWLEYGGGRIIVDLKTCAHDPANARLVAATCLARRYHLQAAAYLDLMAAHGKPCDGFAFVFIRTSPPFNSCLWLLDDDSLNLGRLHNAIALRNLAERLASGDWTGPCHGKENYCSLPKWAFEADLTQLDANTAAYAEFTAYAGEST
jgi:hypothetical protein